MRATRGDLLPNIPEASGESCRLMEAAGLHAEQEPGSGAAEHRGACSKAGAAQSRDVAGEPSSDRAPASGVCGSHTGH